MTGVGVGLRVNSNGSNVEFLAGAYDANGDFATIGDEDFLKHGVGLMRCCWKLTGYPVASLLRPKGG